MAPTFLVADDDLAAHVGAWLAARGLTHGAILVAGTGDPVDIPVVLLTRTASEDDVVLDASSQSAWCAGRAIALTGVEYGLLQRLMTSGSPVPRDVLAEEVLGRPLSPSDRSVDVHVSALRRKLGPRRDGQARIRAVRGVGYLYASGPAP